MTPSSVRRRSCRDRRGPAPAHADRADVLAQLRGQLVGVAGQLHHRDNCHRKPPSSGSAVAYGVRDVLPVGSEPRRAADAPAGRRPAHGAAARLPPAAHAEGGGARARGGDRRGQGARPLLPRVREPDRGRGLRDLPRRPPRPHADLRGRAARRPDLGRADRRVPRALPRARRRALADRRRRAGRPADRRAAPARRAERRRRRSCSRRTRT